MLNMHGDAIQVIHDYMSDPETVWAIGEQAIFSRSADEEAEISLDHAGGCIVGQLGAVRIAAIATMRLAPVEVPTADSWSRAALLCLRNFDASMGQRDVLTELGNDSMAARRIDSLGILFDLGVGAVEADYCVRTADAETCEFLRRHTGERVSKDAAFLEKIESMGVDHIAVSRLGRIERFGKGPPGTRPLKIDVPDGYTACLQFVPPQQKAGSAFDEATHGAFRVLCGIFADLELFKLQTSVAEAVRGGLAADALLIQGAEERTAVRVALRHLERTDGRSETLEAWCRTFEG